MRFFKKKSKDESIVIYRSLSDLPELPRYQYYREKGMKIFLSRKSKQNDEFQISILKEVSKEKMDKIIKEKRFNE